MCNMMDGLVSVSSLLLIHLLPCRATGVAAAIILEEAVAPPSSRHCPLVALSKGQTDGGSGRRRRSRLKRAPQRVGRGGEQVHGTARREQHHNTSTFKKIFWYKEPLHSWISENFFSCEERAESEGPQDKIQPAQSSSLE